MNKIKMLLATAALVATMGCTEEEEISFSGKNSMNYVTASVPGGSEKVTYEISGNADIPSLKMKWEKGDVFYGRVSTDSPNNFLFLRFTSEGSGSVAAFKCESYDKISKTWSDYTLKAGTELRVFYRPGIKEEDLVAVASVVEGSTADPTVSNDKWKDIEGSNAVLDISQQDGTIDCIKGLEMMKATATVTGGDGSNGACRLSFTHNTSIIRIHNLEVAGVPDGTGLTLKNIKLYSASNDYTNPDATTINGLNLYTCVPYYSTPNVDNSLLVDHPSKYTAPKIKISEIGNVSIVDGKLDKDIFICVIPSNTNLYYLNFSFEMEVDGEAKIFTVPLGDKADESKLQPGKMYTVGDYTTTDKIHYNAAASKRPLKPEGEGRDYRPYLITNAGEFQYMINDLGSSYYKLMYDVVIDDDITWTGMGTKKRASYIRLDGNGKTIKLKDIESYNVDYYGLFGYLGQSGSVKNLTVEGSINLTKMYSYVGGIAANSLGTIENCTNKCTINAYSYSGGIVGKNVQGTVTNCTNEGVVTAFNMAGGIIGYCSGAQVSKCTNKGTVNTTNDNTDEDNGVASGGIIAMAHLIDEDYSQRVTITECNNEGTVSGNRNIGGIVGFVNTEVDKATDKYFLIKSCTNKSDISADKGLKMGIGGIVGRTYRNNIESEIIKIALCTNEGDISNGDKIGGIIGYGSYNEKWNNEDFDEIHCCTNKGDVLENAGEKRSDIGGIAGFVSGYRIKGCTNTGNITYKTEVYNLGGIVGRGYIRCYVYACMHSEGKIGRTNKNSDKGYYIGGIVGYTDCPSDKESLRKLGIWGCGTKNLNILYGNCSGILGGSKVKSKVENTKTKYLIQCCYANINSILPDSYYYTKRYMIFNTSVDYFYECAGYAVEEAKESITEVSTVIYRAVTATTDLQSIANSLNYGTSSANVAYGVSPTTEHVFEFNSPSDWYFSQYTRYANEVKALK